MNNPKKIKIEKKKILSDEEMLVKYIETMSHSGLPVLDKEIMGSIKKICKKESTLINAAYSTLLRELNKNHAEIRTSSFQMIVELFSRSHAFRLLVIKDLELILELTAEIDPEKRLPPPKEVAGKLKKLALSTLQQWKSSYGDAYKQFVVCYNYLNRTKGIDFEGIQREIEDQERVRAHRERVIQRGREEKMMKFQKEFDGMVSDIESSIDVVTNCINLLLPAPDDFFLPPDASGADNDIFSDLHTGDTNESEQIDLRNYGISHSYNLTITVDLSKKVRVKRNEENSSIIDNMKDNLKLLGKKYLPKIKGWLEICKNNANDLSKVESVEYILQKVERTTKKAGELNVEGIVLSDYDSDDDDDDFVEVEKEGFEESVVEPNELVLETCAKSVNSSHNDLSLECKDRNRPTLSNEDRTSLSRKKIISSAALESTCTSNNVEQSPGKSNEPLSPSASSSSDRKKRLLAVAPKLPYDVDLYHWEDDNLTPPTLLSVKMDNPKFWGSMDVDDKDEIPDPRGVEALRTRVIEFSGKFEPVKWTCRAPMPCGKLCPRRDRLKCPFHGPVVPRDENGKCVRPEDERKGTECNPVDVESEEEPVPDWQDPKLLAELKASTGIDLKMPDKKKKKKKAKAEASSKKPRRKKGELSSDILEDIKKRNFPGLTDIKKREVERKERLTKKIFNKSVLRRVANDVTKREHNRHRDKFGDQFNYMYGSS